MISVKTYLKVSGTIFTIVAFVHLLRIILGWDVLLGRHSLPMIGSIVGLLAAGYLAYVAFKLKK